MVNEINEMDFGLKEKKWTMIDEVWIKLNEMKHEKWNKPIYSIIRY